MNVYKINFIYWHWSFSVFSTRFLFVFSPSSGLVSTSGLHYTNLQAPHPVSQAWPLQRCAQNSTRLLSIFSVAKPRFFVTAQGYSLDERPARYAWHNDYNITPWLLTFLTSTKHSDSQYTKQINQSYQNTEKGMGLFVNPLIFLAFLCFMTVRPVQLAFVYKSPWLSCIFSGSFVRIQGTWRMIPHSDNSSSNNR